MESVGRAIRETWGEVDPGLIVKVVLVLAVGWILSRLAGRLVARVTPRSVDVPLRKLLRRLVTYTIFGLALVSALQHLGFDLSVVLGAAGIVTVALGFAAKTAASNFISGLFLIFERPFAVGEVVQLGEFSGVVLAIDLMSVKLRTFDNLLVRVPNEQVLGASVINRTRLPIRRYDMLLGVAYGTDLARLRKVLLELAHDHPLCFEEPKPEVVLTGFGDSAITLRFSVWVKVDSFLDVQNALIERVSVRFEEEGIVIPFPQRVVHYASASAAPAPAAAEPSSSP